MMAPAIGPTIQTHQSENSLVASAGPSHRGGAEDCEDEEERGHGLYQDALAHRDGVTQRRRATAPQVEQLGRRRFTGVLQGALLAMDEALTTPRIDDPAASRARGASLSGARGPGKDRGQTR